MKTILVPTDNPSESDKALRVAAAISAKTGSKIQLLPVTDFMSNNLFQDSAMRAPDSVSSQTHVIELVEEGEPKPGEVPATTEIVGQVEVDGEAKHVLDTTISKEIDLVVIGANLIGGRHELTSDSAAEGTKGATPAMEIIMDANAEGTKGAFAAHEIPFDPVVAKAVKFAHCPVLTVTRASENFEIASAVLVTNFEEGSLPLFQRISQLQQLFNFNLFLLYVNSWYHYEPPDVLEGKLKELAAKHALNNYTFKILDDYTYEEGIIHFSQQVKADLIAIPIDKHKDISQLLSVNLKADATQHQAKYFVTFNVK